MTDAFLLGSAIAASLVEAPADAGAAGAAGETSAAGYAFRLVLVLLLVLANGFFVASEFALVGVRKSRITTLAETGNKRAVTLLRVLNGLDSYISATQLGITLASLALGWVGEQTLTHLLLPIFERVTPGFAATAAAHTVSVAIAFTVITFLHIVLGELAPKTLALERAEAVSLIIAWPMEMFYRVFKAPIWVLNKAGNVVVRAFGLQSTAEHAAAYTEEELRYLVDLSHKGGHLNSGERELIHNVFEFASETVRDCMVPRTAVVAAEDTAAVPVLASMLASTRYSRVPVTEGEDIDSIIGILHNKDVIDAQMSGRTEATARDLMRPAMFVPPSAQLDVVLARMQRAGNHMALVVDEHGGLEGLVTLEDILEELVGEIRDEFDEGDEEPVVVQPDGSYLIDAATPIRALNRRLDLDIPESNRYATLAGYLLSEAGSIPAQGQEITVGGTRFVVDNMRRNRLVTVRYYPASSDAPKKPADAAESRH